jgi:Zn-dependent metalloprotease
MKNVKIYALIISCLFDASLNAQQKPKFLRDDNKEIKDLTKRSSDNGWLEFKNDVKVVHTEFFTKYKNAFGLGVKDRMELVREEVDPKTNFKHYKMQQTFNGIPIEGAEFFLHYDKNDDLDLANGKLCEGLTIESTPRVAANNALATAMKEFKNVTFAWQDSTWENSRKKERGSSATYKPQGKLVVTFSENEELKTDKAVLAYQFDVTIVKPQAENWRIYIDAQTGKYFKRINMIRSCTPKTLSFVSLYNGNQTVGGCRKGTGLFGWGGNSNFLIVDQLWMNIRTLDYQTSCEVEFDADDWGTTNQQYISAHWALEQSWGYWYFVMGRKGWDNNNQQAKIEVQPNSVIPNAFGGNIIAHFNPCTSQITLSTRVMALDIVGHEFTHGIVDQTAHLNGGTQVSRSLDESFADIFGEMIEERTTGATNWRLGNQVPWSSIGLNSFFRDLLNPTTSIPDAQPTIFQQGSNWDPFYIDEHINGGVQNRWFSLLSLGSGQGAAHTGQPVQGIGTVSAASIAKYNLFNFLGSNSTFPDARDGAINSARILYGCGSNELLQTWRAWNAVGLASPIPPPAIPTTLAFDCKATNISISPCWFQGATYNWTGIGGSVSGSVSGVNNSILTLNITKAGSYTINLVATFQGNTVTIPINITVSTCGSGGGHLLREPKFTNNNGFKIYPIPTTEAINVDYTEVDYGVNYRVNVINSTGQVVKFKSINQSSNQIDLQGLHNGLYNIVIYDNVGQIIQASKIIKSTNQ